MPLGLLSIASTLQLNSNKVKVYKPTVTLIKKTDYEKAAIDILKNKPKLIGFSTWCITYPASLLIAKEIKRLAPEIPIVFGGPQASILATKTLSNFTFIDYVLSGEADHTFPQLIKELALDKPNLSFISGLSFRTDSGQIQINRLNGAISNLDNLPIPAYELIPRLKWLKLDVGRGCPFQCTYCSTNQFFENKYRVKSAKRIIDEMLLAFHKRKIKSFSFAHDMFTLNKDFVFELCNKLISIKETKGIEFSWTCSARIDCVNKEMLLKMKDAGCRNIFFGIETGSERMQKIIKKNLDVSKAYEIADICRINRITMHASFIIGFPEETEKELNKTLRSAMILALKGALTQVSELTLLPGTPIFKNHHKKLKFDGRFSNFSRNVCGEEEIKMIKKYPSIFSSFYYLPVKSIDRFETFYLRLIINNSKHFRNTLFILSSFIENRIKNVDLLQLFKNEFEIITTTTEKDQINIPLHWIRVVDNFMIKNDIRNKNTIIGDIFAYETYSALLELIFNSWQLINPQTKSIQASGNFCIKPTPVWKILTTSYKLEKIVPSENNWERDKNKVRKGTYYYLLVAVSEVKCKRIRTSSKEIFLLKNLSELSFRNYVQKVKQVASEKEILLWLKRMRRLGVVEFTEQK